MSASDAVRTVCELLMPIAAPYKLPRCIESPYEFMYKECVHVTQSDLNTIVAYEFCTVDDIPITFSIDMADIDRDQLQEIMGAVGLAIHMKRQQTLESMPRTIMQ